MTTIVLHIDSWKEMLIFFFSLSLSPSCFAFIFYLESFVERSLSERLGESRAAISELKPNIVGSDLTWYNISITLASQSTDKILPANSKFYNCNETVWLDHC